MLPVGAGQWCGSKAAPFVLPVKLDQRKLMFFEGNRLNGGAWIGGRQSGEAQRMFGLGKHAKAVAMNETIEGDQAEGETTSGAKVEGAIDGDSPAVLGEDVKATAMIGHGCRRGDGGVETEESIDVLGVVEQGGLVGGGGGVKQKGSGSVVRDAKVGGDAVRGAVGLSSGE